MKPGRELPVLRALTLIRPWSAAIAEGKKPVENRTWTPPANLVGTYLAIHGGQKYEDQLDWPDGWTPGQAPPGIVAVVRLGGVLDIRTRQRRVMLPQVGPKLTDEQHAKLVDLDDDPWFVGPVGWYLIDVVAIEPVDCKGAQKLWEVPMVAANEVRRKWKEARAASAA